MIAGKRAVHPVGVTALQSTEGHSLSLAGWSQAQVDTVCSISPNNPTVGKVQQR